jgi:hypothetical protein
MAVVEALVDDGMRILRGCHGRVVVLLAVLAAVFTALAQPLSAQTPNDTVTVVAGPQYAAGPLRRFLNGDNWRHLWVQPIRVPVLDLDRLGGGVTPLRQGGGAQTITLHLHNEAGERWIFRSIDKRPGIADQRWELRGSPMGGVVADHVSALHPGGHFAVPPVLEAAGVLHSPQQPFVMPDVPVLGEYRETFAGMLGALVVRPNQGPDRTPGFAGSRRIEGWEDFQEDLLSGHEHRLDEAELLRARLVDMLMGDPDRGTDQWRWARFGDEGAYTWRPIPEDRDWIFARASGVFARVAQSYYPKLVRFDDDYPSVKRLTFSSHIVDRSMLTRLSRQDFDREAAAVRAAVTDEVIERAIAAMPAPYAELSGAMLRAYLRARRDALPRIAASFYEWLADAVDVRGTEENELVEIERRADGSVLVRIRRRAADSPLVAATTPAGQPAPPSAPAPPATADARVPPSHATYYERVFVPGETREVRVHLHAGDNHARVTGAAAGPIIIRVIGGDGDDVLEDLAGNVRFYKQAGDVRVVSSSGTRLDRTRWLPPPPPEGMRGGYAWAPDWGREADFNPAVGYDDLAGVLVGGAAQWTRYGFRRLPYETQSTVRALYAPGTGGMRAEVEVDHRFPNSRRALRLDVRGARMDDFPFHGLAGNNGHRRIIFDHAFVRVAPSLVWWLGPRPGLDPEANVAGDESGGDDAEDDAAETSVQAMRFTGEFRIGPAFGWTRLDAPHLGGEALLPASYSGEIVTQAGALASLELRRHEDRGAPRRGYRVRAHTGLYPFADGAGAFGNVSAMATGYVPLLGDGPHLALRVGGERAFGEFPLFEAAFLGGRHSLRGSRTHEFAGDTRVYGNAELRIPVDTVRLVINAEFGVFGFGDAGRVWLDGAAPDGWRTGVGGGAWLAAFGRAVSVAVGRGRDATRLHAWLGLPF